MMDYINRLPTKFRSSISDFYKDDDGWWITLKCDGNYFFDGYASDFTIHEDTQKDAIQAFKDYIRLKE